METMEMLNKVRAICEDADRCSDCVLNGLFCDIVPEHWTYAEIEEMANAIDNYKKEEE